MSAQERKKLLSDNTSLTSEGDDEIPLSKSPQVPTTEIPAPSELKDEGNASPISTSPPPYSLPPAPVVGGTKPNWGQPPVATGTVQQATVVVQPFPASHVPALPPPSHMGLALIATLFCFFPIGIIALVKSSEVGKFHRCGAYESSKQASQKARYWAMLSIKIGVVCHIIYTVLIIVAIVLRVVLNITLSKHDN